MMKIEIERNRARVMARERNREIVKEREREREIFRSLVYHSET